MSSPPAPSELGRRHFLRLAGLVGGGLAGAGVLAACAGAPSQAPPAAGGTVGAGKTIAVSLNGNNAYSGYVAEGVLKELDGTGYSFTGVQNNFDSSVELGNVQNLLSQGIAGLVVLPADAGTIAKAAQLAKQQDIAVGNALWPGASDADQYFAGAAALDSVAGGGMIGDWLKAQVTPGPVIVVQGILGQGFSERIDQGLDASLAGSGFHVVVREQGFFEREKATTIVESALQAHPDTRAIVAYSASMSNGIASYLKAKNLTGIAHVASDGDDEMFTWLGSPYLRACRYYSAAQTGVLAAKAVRGVLEGHPEPFRATVEQQMVTGDTAKAAIAANPYRYAQYATKARI
ncbi:MAG: ribose transport system substrate-binding protein [Pseudonocardiales bacterium]|jgi:ribose transport system substrate-binding protein|nr:ribose transport system substrate-binding protein [Pseudonocardiales bacterium]